VAGDVLILCREYELWFILGTPPSVAECCPYHDFLTGSTSWGLLVEAAKNILRLSFQRRRTWINMVVTKVYGIRG